MRATTGPGGVRLLPDRLRRPTGVLAVACAVAFLVLAVRYHGDRSPGGFDGWVQSVLPRVGYPRRGLARTTDLTPAAFFVLDAVATVALLLCHRWREAAVAVVGPGLTMLVAEVAKPVVGRTRDGALCLPSGHTAAVTSVALVGGLLLVQGMRARPILAATIGLFAATVVSVGMAAVLVLLGWHFATDTIAGYCVATAITLGTAFAVDGFAERRGGTADRGLSHAGGTEVRLTPGDAP